MDERGLQRVPSEVGGDKIVLLVSMVCSTGHVSDEGKPSTTTSTTTCVRETSREA